MRLLGNGGPAETAGALLLVALGVLAVVAVVHGQERARNAILRRLAGRLGGTFVDGGFLSRSRVDFSVAGCGATFFFHGGSRHSPPYSKVRVALGRGSPETLHILEAGFRQSILKAFGAQDLKIGDAAFDQEYVVKAAPESVAARVFTPERRAAVIRTVRRLRGCSNPTFDLERGSLSVTVRGILRDEAALMALIETAAEFLGHVAAAEGRDPSGPR